MSLEQLVKDAAAGVNGVGRGNEFPLVCDPSGLGGVVLPENNTMHSLERWQNVPCRPRGTITTTTPESFCAAVQRLAPAEAVVYYNKYAHMDVIINDDWAAPNGGDDREVLSGWRDHRIEYRPESSIPWGAWFNVAAGTTTWMKQLEMAEFIQDRQADFRVPDGATMLELAQAFDVHRAGSFKSAQRLDNGSYSVTVEENNVGRGAIEIPAQVTLGMRVFEGMDAYEFKALFRYRINDGKLHMAFKLVNVEDVLRAAVDDVLKQVKATLGPRDYLRVQTMPAPVTAHA